MQLYTQASKVHSHLRLQYYGLLKLAMHAIGYRQQATGYSVVCPFCCHSTVSTSNSKGTTRVKLRPISCQCCTMRSCLQGSSPHYHPSNRWNNSTGSRPNPITRLVYCAFADYYQIANRPSPTRTPECAYICIQRRPLQLEPNSNPSAHSKFHQQVSLVLMPQSR